MDLHIAEHLGLGKTLLPTNRYCPGPLSLAHPHRVRTRAAAHTRSLVSALYPQLARRRVLQVRTRDKTHSRFDVTSVWQEEESEDERLGGTTGDLRY